MGEGRSISELDDARRALRPCEFLTLVNAKTAKNQGETGETRLDAIMLRETRRVGEAGCYAGWVSH